MSDRRFLLKKIGEFKAFFITDLHLGFEAEWSRKGLDISQPKWSMEIIDSLKEDIVTTKATHVFILGDLEHTFRHFNKKNGEKIKSVWVSGDYVKEKIFEYFRKQILSIPEVDFTFVRGNQDIFFYKKLGPRVKIYPGSGVSLFTNQLGLFHGNTRPDKKVLQAKKIIFGHIHPTVLLIDRLELKHKLPVFAHLEISREELIGIFYDQRNEIDCTDDMVEITILPAYNRHLGGFALNKKREIKKSFPMLEKIISHPDLELQLTDGVYLGKLVDLY
ncbi:MAG: hypothetical protein ACTSW1_14655 [Candidatus Hodarchaeales archaeon]